ncbi:hypothetical protein L3Y19_gp122 [Gordonia phage Neville]|uniref:Uncharacterized protein n=2 Tax=Nevillevirus TaxID=3044773 RepID=A0A515MH54_9CAUD|nr:hypothetical protein L3Y19_gp122 [Gordonia phage Neville]YP_010246088.1 hypothetical protein L3Y20_gp122 [Gordonia phage Trax]AXQ64465.1 hypothetical protein SEA_NEVILLE_108 [Gordonia phage Neville]QDM55990.1 hypothetical protein SEA_TRAX_110 [Gordonia phage Trax]
MEARNRLPDNERIQNWLGQYFSVGNRVCRGARDGNTSSFKVGIVVGINAEKRNVRVHWVAKPAGWRDEHAYRIITSHHSTSNVDTLFRLADTHMTEAVDHALTDAAMRLRD